ncbi:RNA polymerase sigma factor [Parapedobacter sp. 10938]|uniref:RNA polymerase sigma factor n=1 Tax=Parapedobacter flavus TaxID=3110225 RepID=UPI002DB99164|nr:sigma-70 family RNA polymerase sigma factor [Parapedobacter sp. 10938]MEC3881397.1 sigma-70 family RNA polymerase sigma factor [Parapedobacter sp. 10938]
MDEKDDDFLADIFEGRVHLTAEMEEGLYSRYWGKLMAVARRYVPARETAREVVNDSFVKAFRKLSTLKGNGDDKKAVLEAWLVRITVNTAIDRLRAQRTLPDTLAIDGLENHPAIEMDDALDVEDILRLLQGLPELHRIVFNLYELEGYSHDEIAQLMGIPTSSSRVYLAKAKQELRVLYIKYFGGRHDG